MELEVKLEVFEGPLDLLLHLIEKNKVDIYDIPIVEITRQYLEYVSKLAEENLDLASEFLVMASTLIDIKCKMLLPKEVDEDGEEIDPRTDLVQKLIEYKMYKYAAIELKDMQLYAGKSLYKEPTIPEEVAKYQPPVDLDEILKSLKEKKKYHLLKDGTILDLQDKYIQDLKDIIETIGVPASKLQKEMQIPLFKMMRFESIFDQKAIPKEIEQFLYDLKNYKHKNYPLNPKLASILRDYQKEGFRWLYNLAKYNVGGILADDMGLGKSLQIISLLSSFKTKNPNLIVAPSSLTYNWYNEFKKWDEQCDILLITGNGQVREQLIKNIQPTQTIITSYDYLKRDLELYQNLQFHFMVIDEAQNIKNFATKNAESVKEIKAITKFAVTGTPLENSLFSISAGVIIIRVSPL